MAEWRMLRGWSARELAARVEAARTLRPTAPVGSDPDLTPAAGWNDVLSHALVAREKPGPPAPDGPFERGRQVVARYAFSDRRIVVAHFGEPRAGPVGPGRDLLLELKCAGLHFLCPGRIGAVRDLTTPVASEFAVRLDTLEGHVEAGREWFRLIKDHGSGEISFRIEAGWRPGQFPGAWARLGFRALGRRYQRAWHRLAHEHLRAALSRWDANDRAAWGCAPVHRERGAVTQVPVQFIAQKAQRQGLLPRIRVEHEREAPPARRPGAG